MLIWAYIIALIALATDQASKFWALKNLSDGRQRPLLGSFLRLELTANPGAAFSLGSQTTIIFTCIACVVVTAIVMFIGYGTWFIGNVADIWIVCAVVILLIASFAGNKHSVR